MIRLRVLGSIELIDSKGRDSRAILAQPKRLGLLAYLAAAPSVFHRRDTLLALFWPELDEAHARSALSQAIRFLRRELGSTAALENRGAEEIGVNRTLLWCDAAAFLDDVEAERYGEALERYRGDFLSGFFINCGPDFDHWLETTRAQFRSRAATAARRFAEAREHDERYTTAVASARRAVDLSGADERVVCELLDLLDRLGDRAGAVRAFEVFARRLADEYGVEPAAETKAVIDRIRNRDALKRQSLQALPPAFGLALGAGTPGSISSVGVPDFNGWRATHEIGRGGMAIVYLAKDAKHDRSVALKVIPREHTSTIGGERFVRESQILASLAHPHILPLIDSGEADGVFCLVTPYIAGGSLRMRLRAERKLPVDDAVRIAREVASALDYAHRHGVIHRDIKPENILLQDGHAIVADFGIATVMSADAGVRGIGGRSPGTPAYMSPEQTAGDANLGAPSDVYSLGAVLYEMLAGTPPSKETTLVRTIRRDVPRHVEDVIRQALSRVPGDRFASADAFSRALIEHTEASRRIPRLPLLAAGAVLFGALIGATVAARARGFGFGTSLIAAGTLRPAERLIVTDFRVAGVDSGIGRAIGYAARSALSQARDIRVISSDEVSAALQRMRRSSAALLDLRVAREVAAREGIRTIVDGHVVRTGSTFDVGLRLVSADLGRDLVTMHAPASTLDDIIPVIDRLTRTLRSKIGESVKTVEESPPLPRMTTRSVEALRFFAEHHRVSEWAQKRVFLERAVAADSEFAEAWRQLAAVYFNLGIPGGNPLRDSAEAKAYRYRTGLSPIERFRIEARHYATLGDRERHMQTLEQSLLLGDSVFALNGLGESYWKRREFAKAEQLERIVVRVNPVPILGYANVAEKLVEQGKLDAADSVVDAGLARTPNSWGLVKSRIRHLYHRGQLDAYERAVDSVRAVADPVARRAATSLRRDLALVRGQLREWTRLRSESGLPEADNAQSEMIDEALVFLWIRHDTARAAERFQRAATLRLPAGPSLLEYGRFFASTGRTALARQYLERFEAASDTTGLRRYAYLVHRLRGDLARAEGRIEESLNEIRQGDRLPDGPVDACIVCLYASLGDTFDRAAMADSAIAMFERYADTPNAAHITQDRWHLPRILNRLGQLHESKGNRDAAVRYYERFVNLWSNADPELQPRVAIARRRLVRLKRTT